MHKHIIILLLLLLNFSGVNFIFSQALSKSDSLFNLLKETEDDTAKINLYNELSYELIFSNKDTSEVYAKHALSYAINSPDFLFYLAPGWAILVATYQIDIALLHSLF